MIMIIIFMIMIMLKLLNANVGCGRVPDVRMPPLPCGDWHRETSLMM
jgi:hypothetical protein